MTLDDLCSKLSTMGIFCEYDQNDIQLYFSPQQLDYHEGELSVCQKQIHFITDIIVGIAGREVIEPNPLAITVDNQDDAQCTATIPRNTLESYGFSRTQDHQSSEAGPSSSRSNRPLWHTFSDDIPIRSNPNGLPFADIIASADVRGDVQEAVIVAVKPV